ncbi:MULTISPECIES: hypothetical protein [unclassified Bartonella]|uniref:hypothetical protein n=1 Tax=unclassified Bartonella TaxID=2645622 RepID=UPI0035CFC592
MHYNKPKLELNWIGKEKCPKLKPRILLEDLEKSYHASNQIFYLKVMTDEIFGCQNFINNIIWQKKYAPQNDTKWLSDNHDFIMGYAKNKTIWRPNLLPRSSNMDARYKNPDNDSRGSWKSGDLSVKRVTLKDIYEIITPSGRKVMPPNGRNWAMSEKNSLHY